MASCLLLLWSLPRLPADPDLWATRAVSVYVALLLWYLSPPRRGGGGGKGR